MAEPPKKNQRGTRDTHCRDQMKGSIKHMTHNKPCEPFRKYVTRKKVVQVIDVPGMTDDYSPSEDMETIRTNTFEQEKQRVRQVLEKRIEMVDTDCREIRSVLNLVEGFLNESGHDDASKASAMFAKGRFLTETARDLMKEMDAMQNDISDWDVHERKKLRRKLENHDLKAVQLLSNMGKWKRKVTRRDVSLTVSRS